MSKKEREARKYAWQSVGILLLVLAALAVAGIAFLALYSLFGGWALLGLFVVGFFVLVYRTSYRDYMKSH